VTFAARGILVSLAFFAVVYCLLSSLVVLVWEGIRRMGWRPSSSSANLLFGLRILPFVTSPGCNPRMQVRLRGGSHFVGPRSSVLGDATLSANRNSA